MSKRYFRPLKDGFPLCYRYVYSFNVVLTLITPTGYSRQIASVYRWLDLSKHVFLYWSGCTLGSRQQDAENNSWFCQVRQLSIFLCSFSWFTVKSDEGPYWDIPCQPHLWMLTRLWNTKESMCQTLLTFCRYINYARQILALILDNAANNNTLVKELGDLLDGHQGSLARIRCFAHILNLVVKVGNLIVYWDIF